VIRHGHNAATHTNPTVANVPPEAQIAVGGERPPQTQRRAGRIRRARATLAATPGELRALLAVAAVLSLAWAIAMAPFQAPDELEHFGYAQRLAETGKRPSATSGRQSVSAEETEAVRRLSLFTLRGVAAAREGWNPVEQREWRRAQNALPPSARADGEGPNSAAKNPPLYYVAEAVPYQAFSWSGLFSRLFAMRLVGCALFVATVALTWLLAGELFSARWPRVVAAGVVALQPELGAAAGAVNPDILLAAIWTAFLLAGIRVLRRGPTRGRVAAMLGCVAAAALTHGRGLPLVIPALFVLGVLFARLPSHRRRVVGVRAGVGAAALIALAAVAAVGGAYASVRAGIARFSLPDFVATTWQFYFPKLPLMGDRLGPDYGFRQVFIETFYGTYGSLEIRLPHWAMRFLQLASVGGFAIVVAMLVARWRAVDGRRLLVAFLALSAASLVAFLHLASYTALVTSKGDPVIVGRYLLSATAVLGLAVAFVANALPRRAGASLAGAVLSVGCLLQIAALGLTMTRFYA
jgi:Dolichyl-phosphate-mannose-protein mannosyltransferase